MQRSVIVFVRNNEDPHIATDKTHQQSWEISFVTPHVDFAVLGQIAHQPDRKIDGAVARLGRKA